MEIFKNINYDSYALWMGDNINKKLNIPTKNELALKIYQALNEEIKEKVENKECLTEVSQVFLDSATGNMMNLISLLSSELELKDHENPYSYLSKIGVIDTIITHDHSKILESIWEKGEIHNVFSEKEVVRSNVNLFKILGDYSHTERIILTSQNMRKLKKLKLYDHFWGKLNTELENKNLILLGMNLTKDTKDILSLVFSKTNLSKTSRYFVTSNPISLEDESWLISNEFEFIYEEDLNFVKKMALYFNDENIDPVKKEVELVKEDIEKIQMIEIEEEAKVEDKLSNLENVEKNIEKVVIQKEKTEDKEKKQLKIFEKEEDHTKTYKNLDTQEIILEDKEMVVKDTFENIEPSVEVKPIESGSIEGQEEFIVESNILEVVEEDIKAEIAEIESIEGEYLVENLEIPLYLDKDTLKGEIIETEVRNRQKRLVEFRENRYPSYKVDDFSEIDHYKALDIKIPFESTEFPQVKLEKKIFAGKVDIRCHDQTIYGVAIKSHMSGKYQVIDFKTHDFSLRLLLEDDRVMKFAYKISENTVNIKGRNIYIFFKNLFTGFELNFKNKKTQGDFKVVSSENVEKLEIILEAIDKYLSIKKQVKTKDVKLKELLKNTRSLEVLFSFYNNTPKVTSGNITIRTNFLGDITKVEKLELNYPISINFLGLIRSFIESTKIEIDSSNINYVGDKLEIQAFNIVENTTYREIKK